MQAVAFRRKRNETPRRKRSAEVQTQDHRYGGKACPPTFSGKRAYQEGAGFVVADELSADLFRRRLRVAPVTRTPAVDVFGLAIAPSFLLAICSIPSFGNREIRRQRLPPRYQQKYQQNDRLQRALSRTFTHVFKWEAQILLKNQESN
ncbi:MAG TPA: hypothetical protein VHV26_07780 [Rhizomicrobium sp.]|nr:hypothetical protein [Rhizomicrobium sp.]